MSFSKAVNEAAKYTNRAFGKRITRAVEDDVSTVGRTPGAA